MSCRPFRNSELPAHILEFRPHPFTSSLTLLDVKDINLQVFGNPQFSKIFLYEVAIRSKPPPMAMCPDAVHVLKAEIQNLPPFIGRSPAGRAINPWMQRQAPAIAFFEHVIEVAAVRSGVKR